MIKSLFLINLIITLSCFSSIYASDKSCLIQKIEFQDPISRIGQKQIKKIIKSNQSNWEKAFNIKEISKKLNRISNKDYRFKSHQKFFENLKEEGTYIRNLFLLFSGQNRVPKKFDKLIKDIGQLKDFLKNKKKSLSIQKAQEILKRISKLKNSNIFPNLQPATPEQVLRQFKRSNQQLRNIIQQETHTIYDLHKIKKTLRTIVFGLNQLEKIYKTKPLALSSYKRAYERSANTLKLWTAKKVNEDIKFKSTDLIIEKKLVKYIKIAEEKIKHAFEAI